MQFLKKYHALWKALFLSAAISGCSGDPDLSKAPCIPTTEKENICDALDDNCNGQIDEGCDDDNDGYCEAGYLIGSIDLEKPFWNEPEFTCAKTFQQYLETLQIFWDCNDQNAEIHPFATEICNGWDDDCSGQIDNSIREAGRACYLNPASGEMIDASSPETLTATSLEELCGPSTIACERGRLICSGLGSSQEICDGIDNNCNALTDELIPAEPCYGGWGEVDGVLQYIDGLQEGSLWYGTLGVGECWGGNFTCTQNCEMLPEYISDCQQYVMGGDQLCQGAITPLAEVCNGRNDNCNSDGIDEEYDQDGDVYTTCGTYARQMERMSPLPELVDCNDEDASVNPGMLEVICNGKNDDCNRETIDSTDTDEDTYPIDCAPAIPFDCDDSSDDDPDFCAYVGMEDCSDGRFSACAPCINPGAPEKCGDCRDNNCNGIVDEGTVAGINHDFFLAVDCSGSMNSKNTRITEAIGRILWTDCYDPNEISITTVFVGDRNISQPFLAGIQESGNELRDNYAGRFPNSCSGDEYTLDAKAYALCILPAENFLSASGDSSETANDYSTEYTEVCLPLQTEVITVLDYLGNTITFNPLEDFLAGNEPSDIWRTDAQHHMLLLADEDAQSRFPYIDQWKIGQLARQAGVSIDMYILPLFFTTTTLGGAYGGQSQGYAYLICDAYDAEMNCIGNSNGTMTNITSWARSEEIGNDLVDKFTAVYCLEEEEEEEESEE